MHINRSTKKKKLSTTSLSDAHFYFHALCQGPDQSQSTKNRTKPIKNKINK